MTDFRYCLRHIHLTSLFLFQDFTAVMSERGTASSDSEFLDRVAGNPIHAYKMMKRFAVDWKKLEADLTEDDWKGKMVVRWQSEPKFGPQGSISSTCLCTAFMHADSESAKSCLTWLSFFALLGSAYVKVAWKMLVKFLHLSLHKITLSNCELKKSCMDTIGDSGD